MITSLVWSVNKPFERRSLKGVHRNKLKAWFLLEAWASLKHTSVSVRGEEVMMRPILAMWLNRRCGCSWVSRCGRR